MTTQKNRDATVFLVSQNAVITRPVKSQPQPKNIKHQQAGRFVKKKPLDGRRQLSETSATKNFRRYLFHFLFQVVEWEILSADLTSEPLRFSFIQRKQKKNWQNFLQSISFTRFNVEK